MFRQVIAYRWTEGVSDDQKDAFRAAFAGLRDIAELSSLRFADDAKHFEGNFDVVAVMDFPDFVAARRYVADERHQAYIRDFASKMIGERVVVQHDWAVHDLVGVHHATLPVSDLAGSSDWYARAFGFTVTHESADEVTLMHREAAIELVLRLDAPRAEALAGFDAITFSVGTVDDLDALIARLDAEGITHSAPVSSGTGTRITVADPDGLLVQITTLLP